MQRTLPSAWRRCLLIQAVVMTSIFTYVGGYAEGAELASAPCHLYDRSTALPEGWGVPYNTFSSARELLFTASCEGSQVTLSLGNADQGPLYVWHIGYLWTGTTWKQLTFTGTEANEWIPDSAQVTVSRTTTQLNTPTYVAGYLCQQINDVWKCGCRNAACTSPSWLLQAFQRTSAVETPTPTSATSDTLSTAIEQAIHSRTNQARRSAGVPELAFDDKLANIARAHSHDMGTNKYFSHTNLSGCSSGCRIKEAGYTAKATGENIAYISTRSFSADAYGEYFVNLWLGSSGHRANMLNSTWTNEGIGIAIINGRVYATADFAR